jgi:1,4-dihydroxy-2-naphthoate octaprenyltransferase
MEVAIGLTVAVAGVVGLYLVSMGGWALLVVGLLAVVAALAYTGGPLPYGYRGLGEVFVFLFFGLVAVTGTAYLQALRVEPVFVVAAIPVGALVTAILVVNNLRDAPTDAAAGKRTLAVIWGDGFAKAEYVACLVVAGVVPVVLLILGGSGVAILLPLASPVLGLTSVREVLAVGPGSDRRGLNPVLRSTARLALVYGALFAVGLAIGGAG